MIAVDTNIIVRLLTGDDETQAAKAREIFKSNQVFIADTVILELEWVLRYAYGFSPSMICNAFRIFFGLPNVYINHPILIKQAIDWHQQGYDFADAMHLAFSKQCTYLYTFDHKFAKKACSLSECQVLNP